MAKLGTAYVDVVGNFAPLKKGLAGNAAGIKSRLAAIGKYGALAGAALGVSAIKSSIDYDHALTLVETQAGATHEEVSKLRESILDFTASGKTEFKAEELAHALFRVESAGIRGTRAFKTLKASSDLATIGQAELEDTTKALVAAQKTGIRGSGNLKKAIGTLNATVGSGQLKLEDLVAALGTGFLATSRAAGLSLTDVGGALSTVTKQGTPARAAATRLRMAFSLMAAPTDTAQEALKSIGLGQFDLAHEMRGPEGILGAMELLRESLSELPKTQQLDIVRQAFGGARSGGTILQLLQNTDDLDKTLVHIREHAGEVDEALARAEEDPMVRLRAAGAQLDSVLIRIGTVAAPAAVDALSEVADIIADPKITADEKFSKVARLITDAFRDAVEPVTKAAVKMGLAAAKGIAEGFLKSDLLGKIFIGGALIRIFGGKGALKASGLAIGRLLGIGVATGVASTAGAAGVAGAGAGAAGGAAATRGIAFGALGAGAVGKDMFGISAARAKAVGLTAGGSAASGFTSKFSQATSRFGAGLKNVKWAKIGGLGIGLAVVDGVLSEIEQQSQARSSEFEEALAGLRGGGEIFGKSFDPRGFIEEGAGGILKNIGFEGLSEGEKAARQLTDRLKELGEANKAITPEIRREVMALAAQTGMTDEAKASLIDFLATGKGFGNWRDQLRAVADDRSILQIQDNFDFLRSSIPTSLHDIARVVKSSSGIINTNLGEGSRKGRKAMAENFRLAADAIKRGMDRGVINVKQGRKKIHDLLREANILDPTKKWLRGFSGELAREFHQGKKITGRGVDRILEVMKGLDKGSRQIFARSLMDKLRIWNKEGKLSDKVYKDIKSRILSTFTDIEIGGRKKSFDLGSVVIDNVFGLAKGIFGGFSWIKKTASKALEGFGGDPLKFLLEKPSGKGSKGGLRRQLGGPIPVPGSGTSDSVPLHLAGKHVANVAPRELINVTNAKAAAKWQEWNKTFPRFGGGGTMDRTGVVHLARGGWLGDSPAGLNPAVKSIAQYAMNKYGASASDTVAPRSGSSWHPVGAAVDLVNGPPQSPPMLRMARGLVGAFQSKLEELIYTPLGFSISGGQRVAAYAQADHLDHVHIAALGKAVKGAAAAFKKIGRVVLKGPDGPLKEAGQGVLDKVRKQANAYLEKRAPMGGDIGGASFFKGGGRFMSSAYGPPWGGIQGTGVTATGVNLVAGPKRYLVAVDPDTIPLHSQLRISPNPFDYRGKFAAEDTGGAIQGNRIDFYDWMGREHQNAWGMRNVNVKGLVKGGVIDAQPILASLKDGGLILKTGAYHLHQGETVVPALQRGGHFEPPHGLPRLRRHKRDLGDRIREAQRRLETHLTTKQRDRLKKLAKLAKQQDKIDDIKKKLQDKDLSDADKKQLKKKLKSADVMTKKQERELDRLRTRREDHPRLTKGQRKDLVKLKRDKDRTKEEREQLQELREKKQLHEKQADLEKELRHKIRVLETKKATDEELISEFRQLRQEYKELNKRFGIIQGASRAAIISLSDSIASQIGSSGLQIGRTASAGRRPVSYGG